MTRYYLAREIEKARAKHKPITIELPDVDPVENQHDGYRKRDVEVDPPVLWPDSTTVAAQVNPAAAARTLIGADEYEHWVAAGGTAGILFEIIRSSAGAESLGESQES